MKTFQILILILGLDSYFPVLAQNLVPNPSFEFFSNCPHLVSEITKATPWFSPSTGSPDYFNACNDTLPFNSFVGVPRNVFGFENAHSGNGYAGITTGLGDSFREYLESRLLDTLKAGRKYHVEFYTSLSDSSWICNNSIGAYFSPVSINRPNASYLQVTPQITNASGNNLSIKNGWAKVEGSFFAHGDEEYIVIGCFVSTAQMDTLYVGGGGTTATSSLIYNYFDDISVILDTTTNIDDPNFNFQDVSIIPNPFNDELNVSIKNNFNQLAKIEIFDLLGTKVIRDFEFFTNQVQLETTFLPKGMYVIKISLNDFSIIKRIVKY